jgi:hypothetical protein
MIDESLLKSNFLGRDGFRWWIGQIAPIDAWKSQAEGGGWSYRYKVRIIGYHPYNVTDLSNEDLPWAQVLLPTTAGTGAANCSTGVQLQPSDVVFGFFLDGDNAQIPVIMGAFGRTSEVSKLPYSNPFVPFTGNTDYIPKQPATIKSSENSEQTKNSAETPPNLPPEIARIKDPENPADSQANGERITLASPENDAILGIKNEVKNLLKKIRTFLKDAQNYLSKVSQEIRKAADSIAKYANDFVGQSFDFLINGNENFPGLVGLLKNGLDLLYKQVYALVLAATANPVAAHLAGVAAQEAMLVPVKLLEDAITCVAGAVVDSLKDVVSDLLYSVVENIERFVSCAADQFIGTLVNTIIDTIEGGLSTVLGGLEKLLQFFSDFSVGNVLRTASEILQSSGISFDCNQNKDGLQGMAKEWVVGAGEAFVASENYQNIMEAINLKNVGQNLNEIVECFTGAIENASVAVVNIFGGGSAGFGAIGIPIFGSYTQDSNGVVRASVIGVQVTNGGSGYTYPPFVEIVDDADQGYGATARALINDMGQVTSIYIVSEGENYTPSDITEYSVSEVIIEQPGSGYEDGDIVVDNLGNEYKTQVVNGFIYQVEPLNNVVQSLPVLTVKSQTGGGAVLRPILSDPKFTGEVQKVIDCVT